MYSRLPILPHMRSEYIGQGGVASFFRALARFSVFLGMALNAAVAAGPARVLLSGPATQVFLEASRLPAGTDPTLYKAAVNGKVFGAYSRDIPAGDYIVELGFIAVNATAAGQDIVAVEADGVPLDARLDIWKQAGGSYVPWVLKAPITHGGGMFGLQFTALTGNATLSFVRLSRPDGTLVAEGAAADWKSSDRLKMLDARSREFRQVPVGETPFFNLDHSPVGALASFVYGMEASGGVQMGASPAKEGYLMPHDGVIVAIKRGNDVKVMPFYVRPTGSSVTPKYIAAGEVHRTIGPATDHWELPDGVSWTHYTPSWEMADWETASEAARRQFAMPATWLTFTLDNSGGREPLDLAFALEQPAVRSTEWKNFSGYVVAEDHAVAVRSGEAEAVDAGNIQREFGLEGATAAFRVHVAAGTKKDVTFYIVHHRSGQAAVLAGEPLELAHAALFHEKADVIAAADAAYPKVVERCQAENSRLAAAKLSPERAFLSADSIHSYQFNTVLFTNIKTHQPVWVVVEGEYRLLNTLDLTVDHVFYELALHPWTVRNELDVFLDHYSFTDQLQKPGETALHPGALGFYHDMGSGYNFASPAKGQAYSALMTQEELQNWLICAALYWHATQDDAWLRSRRDALTRGFASMLERDDIDPAKRDGITSYRSVLDKMKHSEITTYDAMDHSLQQAVDSLYITVKSFATYLVLEPAFRGLGDTGLADECLAAATRTEHGLLAHWDDAAKCFPATFDGPTSSRIIPAIEGLIYPFEMGERNAVSLDGPHGALIRRLRQHMETILVSGVCLDSRTGGWILSNTSNTTWQSKVYLNQFITEKILGITDDRVEGRPDRAHYSYQVLGSPAVCWTCQIFTKELTAFGCRHYPRGVTSALWWLPDPPAAGQ